jgi:putative flippase GtrA
MSGATVISIGVVTAPRLARPATVANSVSWLRSDAVAAQLIRFAGTGVVTSLVQFGVFFLLFGLGDQVANLAGVALSSVLANEMHRRLTFRAGSRVTWLSAQWEGGGLSAAALAATSLALALLDGVVGDEWWTRVLLIAAVNAVVGLSRFVLLRVWVFAGR